jgi:Polyketide cyclase / dehydrase and lipid transport
VGGRRRVLRSAVGVAGVALLYARVWRPWQLHWGATADEVSRPLPGDDIVPRPWFDATRAVTIEAAPEHVWPWLAQMGAFTRAGWYSYDALDNKGVASSEVVVPELQGVRVGDRMLLSEDGQGFTVEAVEPCRTLVLAVREDSGTISAAYQLGPLPGGRTRLVQRIRHRIRPRKPGQVLLVVAMDVGELLMARRSLLGIKDRAERRARARPGAHDPVDHSPASPLTYELSVVVRRRPAEVYAVLADVQDWTDTPRSGVSMVKEPPGETRPGTSWRESVRLGPGLSLVVRSVVTEAGPDRTLAMTFSAPLLTGSLRYTLEATPDGTLLRQSQRLRLRAPFGAIPRTVDRAFRRRVVRRLADVRDLVEDLPVPVSTSTL